MFFFVSCLRLWFRDYRYFRYEIVLEVRLWGDLGFGVQRHWKTHNLCDLFTAIERGRLPLCLRQFTNFELSHDPHEPIKRLDVNWPYSDSTDEEGNRTTMNYKIEDGIPVPPIHRKIDCAWIPTVESLAPGQSFVIPCTLAESVGIRAKVMAKCKELGNNASRLYVSRKILENEQVVGIRVWRVS